MPEPLIEGPDRATPRTEAPLLVAVLPIVPPEEGADPDQYLWGV